jgi:SAM-dependent methyltransferase
MNVVTELADWQSVLVCPVDKAPLLRQDGKWCCAQCDFVSAREQVKDRRVPDFRARGVTQQVSMTFQIPVTPLDRAAVASGYFRAVSENFPHYSKWEVREKFGTKLDKGIQHYCQQLWRQVGKSAVILDLGCGNGGNRLYLRSLGFEQVLTVDWAASGADLLVDAHRLPFADGSFDMVISTAVLEHLYNPYLAMHEVARVLKPGGLFVGSASFWEAWHGSSYFHLSPDGWATLLEQNCMELMDLWAGWGIIPSALSHVLTPGYLRGLGYALQAVVDSAYRLVLGEMGVRKLKLRASGAYVICARKRRS